MLTYFLVVVIVVICSLPVLYFLQKNKLLNVQMGISIAITSITVSLIFPFAFAAIKSRTGIFVASLITVLVYITSVLMFAVFISLVLSEQRAAALTGFLKTSLPVSAVRNIIRKAGNNSISSQVNNEERIAETENTQSPVNEIYVRAISSDAAHPVHDNTDDPNLHETGIADFESFRTTVENEASLHVMPDDVQNLPYVNINENGLEENMLEKSVDSEQNIDTMGIENLNYGVEHIFDNAENSPENTPETTNSDEKLSSSTQDFDVAVNLTAVLEQLSPVNEHSFAEEKAFASYEEAVPGFDSTNSTNTADSYLYEDINESLTIDDCINKAFELKTNGDLEGSILYYMYALDKQPDKHLVFWIVLDICSLYKNLGQVDMAREILNGYAQTYGEIIDSTVKCEIEKSF